MTERIPVDRIRTVAHQRGHLWQVAGAEQITQFDGTLAVGDAIEINAGVFTAQGFDEAVYDRRVYARFPKGPVGRQCCRQRKRGTGCGQ